MMKHMSAFVFAAILTCVAPAAFAADTDAPASPASSLQFDDFKTHVDGTLFSVNMPFKGDFATADLQATYLDDAFQIDIPGASFSKGKHLLRANGKVVKSVFISQYDENTVRLRVTLNKGFRGSELAESLKIARTDGAFNLSFDAGIDKVTTAPATEVADTTLSFNDGPTSSPRAKAVVKDEIIEQARLVARDAEPATAASKKEDLTNTEAMPLAAEAAVADAAVSGAGKTPDLTTKAAAVEASKKVPESEIPLVAEKDTKKSEGPPWQRIVVTLGVMTMMGVGASFGMKKWSKSARGRVAKNARIKVLTQHHLGPKKQLMIVEVAGESMLIGVTDHNITMLKSLSLLDDEIPEALPQSFEGAMEDNFIETQNHAKPRLSAAQKNARAQQTLVAATEKETDDDGENFALHGLSEIRDKVSTRLKNMRPL